MSTLNLNRNIAAPDDLYQQLINMHEGLDIANIMKANIKLILLLANHVGDQKVITQAIEIATPKAATKVALAHQSEA